MHTTSLIVGSSVSKSVVVTSRQLNSSYCAPAHRGRIGGSHGNPKLKGICK